MRCPFQRFSLDNVIGTLHAGGLRARASEGRIPSLGEDRISEGWSRNEKPGKSRGIQPLNLQVLVASNAEERFQHPLSE